jgi:predicted dehydrogenase
MYIAGLCDVDKGRLQKTADVVGQNIPTYMDYRELLSDPKIDAVLICTPNLFHKQIVLDSLEAGKFVICEKPMAISWQECQEMKAAEKKYSKFVFYSMQLRYAHKYQDLKNILKSGKIGKPQYIFLPEHRGDWYTGDPWLYTNAKTGKKTNWRYTHDACGGTLNEKMCHYFDVVNWMVDAVPISIMCDGGINHYKDERDTWDHANVHIEYPDNIKALFSLCMYAPHRLDPQIIGEEGSLHLFKDYILFEGTGVNRSKKEEIALTQEIGHGEKGLETSMIRMYQHFLDCTQNGEKPFTDVEVAKNASKIAWLSELSAQKGHKVLWHDI